MTDIGDACPAACSLSSVLEVAEDMTFFGAMLVDGRKKRVNVELQ